MLWTVVMSTIVASCVFMYTMTPYYECLIQGCDKDSSPMGTLAWVYPRSVSAACLMAYVATWPRYRGGMVEYDSRIAVHDAYDAAPTAARAADHGRRTVYRAAVLSACALLILPVNAARLIGFYEDRQPASVFLYYGLIYTHNALTCLLETRFVLLCYALYVKFVNVNRDMVSIGDQIGTTVAAAAAAAASDHGYWMVDDRGLYRSRATGRLLVDVVEELRIRHRLLCEAVDQLHYVFAVPVGVSLCNLCLMALYDVYYELLKVYNHRVVPQSNVYIYAWLVQYSFRFFIVVIMIHITMEQALKSKVIITHVSRICLDINTKEELQLFSDQISSIVEFSICGLFTLNSQLFISAVGISSTYLVILLQLKSKMNDIGLQ